MRIKRFSNYLVFSIIILLTVSCGNGREEFFVQTVEIPEDYTYEQTVELSARVLPHPRQMKWFEDEFFGFIHYGPNTYSGREWGTGFEDAALFNPGDLDTDQWCELMKAAGIRRVIMVVKHHEGYCLWQTRYTDHSVASSPWRDGQGDVLRELAESAEKYGLRLGVYLSPADLYQIESENGYYGNGSEFTERVIPRKVAGRPFEDDRSFTYVVDDYNEYFMNQLFELLTEYGPVFEVWFDGANPKPGTGQTYTYDAWYEMIYELAPDAAIFGKGPDARWCGNEGGRTRDDEYNVIPLSVSPDSFDWPDMTAQDIAGRERITKDTRYFHYYPAETNTSIRHGWFWRNDDEQQVRSADDVFDIYERSVGGNSIFHLNIPPNKLGQFSDRDAEVLLEVGRRIDAVYGVNLLHDATTDADNILDGDTGTWWQSPAKETTLEISIPEKRLINRLMIKEAIAHRSERVEEHYLEARINGEWVHIADGKTIGHKRILRFPAVNTDAFRLSIMKSRLEPAIAHISAHYYDEPPKPVVIRRDGEGMLTLGVGLSFAWNNHGMTDQSQPIYYTLDGSEPTTGSIRYEEPFPLPGGGFVRARAIVEESEGPVSERYIGLLRAGWTATDPEGREEEASMVLDGNSHTRWIASEEASSPYSLTIDMRMIYKISGFSYVPAAPAGFIESYEVEVSPDGEKWETIHRGAFGNIINDPSRRIVTFDGEYDARFFRLSNLQAPGAVNRVGAADIELLPADNN
ncbi:MAG: alpha-L-fucosidase [Bacteroidales bacterium]